MASSRVLQKRVHKIWQDTFAGKTPNSQPVAIIMAGAQGSGKSTKAKSILRDRKNFTYINPDSTLIALNGGRKKLPDDQPEIFSESQALTEQILTHAVTSRFNICLDTSIPSTTVLKQLKALGYTITFVVMSTPAELARKREVIRDLTQLNWGRAGISSAAQRNTAAELTQRLPVAISQFADSVVSCQNHQSVMTCSDNSRIRPAAKGPNVSIRAKQKLLWLPRLA